MKCPNHLCQHGLDGNPASCPRCGIPLPGAVMADRFSLEKIGRVTPFSVLYTAFDRERTMEVQLRVYVPRFGRSAAGLKSEIKALKELQFEQLPKILAFNWDADFPWIAEDKIQGGSMISRLVGRERPLAEPEVVQVLLEAGRILEKVHTLHIFHRDIRPEHLFFRDADNRLMLGTPGWDREFADKASGRNRNVYAAPEAGHGRATPHADLYALGVSALHLLTGLNPEGLYNATTRSFQWQRAVKVSPRLAEILDALVAEAPGDRIQTAGRLVQLLAALDRDPSKADDKIQPAEAAPAAVPGVPAEVAAAVAPAATGEAGVPQPAADTSGSNPNPTWAWARRGRSAGGRRERRVKWILAAMAAGLAALAALLAAAWKRALDGPAGQAIGLHGAKILVAIGLASSGAVLAGQFGGAAAPAGLAHEDSRALQATSGGLPAPILGHDDRAIPSASPEEPASSARLLPDPARLSQWLDRALEAEARRRTAAAFGQPGDVPPGMRGGPVSPDGFAFSDGSRTEISRLLSLYTSIFPWQGQQMALGAARQDLGLAEINARQLLAASVGLPPSLMALTTRAPGPSPAAAALETAHEALAGLVPELPPAPASDDERPRRVELADLGGSTPHDAVAEPGHDTDDASGLSAPVSPYFIRINKTYRTLTLYREGRFAAQFPITIGRGATTPDGRFTIANKIDRPSYMGIPGGDPRNPLGNFWLGLDVSYPGGKAIGLHGTNAPESIGLEDSGGCIRLSNQDAGRLYDLVPPGTPVEVI